MLKLKSKIFAAVFCAVGLSAFAAIDGGSQEGAINLVAKDAVQQRAFTLVSDGTNNVYYFKMTLAKKKAYTIWLSNLQSATPGEKPTIAISETYPQDSFEVSFSVNAPSADFEIVSVGSYVGWVMTGKTWERETEKWETPVGDDIQFKVPSTWVYYIVVRGAKGDSATLNYCLGNRIPEGLYQNPVRIEPTTDAAGKVKSGCQFYDSDFYFETDFELGRRYYLATDGGAAGYTFGFNNLPAGDIRPYAQWKKGEYNDSIIFVPKVSDTAIWSISTDREENFSRLATLKYRVDPARTIAQHPLKAALAVGKPVAFVPGHLNARNSGAYDAIIDEGLFSFKSAKNRRYVIQASWSNPGRATNMLMRVYDAKGQIVAENRGDGSSMNARCGLEEGSKAQTYYVGVCQDLGDRDDFEDTCGWPAEIVVREVANVTADAVAIHPTAATGTERPLDVDPEGELIGDFTSDVWYRTIKINARAGVTYALFPTAEASTSTFSITGVLYTVSGKKEKVVNSFDFTPGAGDISFKADQSTAYYLRVSVAEGAGLDYPNLTVHSLAYVKDAKVHYGSLKVAPKGAPSATWTLNSEKTVFAVGDSILLPPGTYTVKYGAVKGTSTPASVTVKVQSLVETLVDSGRYGDTLDPKDDYPSGKSGKVKYSATSWALKEKPTEMVRTLWDNDPADYFAFTAKDGYYYDFAFTDHQCDAVLTVRTSAGEVVKDADGVGVSGRSEISKLALLAGKYTIAVTHGTSAKEGGSYALTGQYANVGALKFAKTAISVKDTATTVSASVKRTAKNGSLRVKWELVAGTAKAGEQYYDASGYLEWANGDNKAKTISVRLIPKLGAWYNGGNHAFSIRLTDASEEGDYKAKIAGNECKVTITETSKASVTQASVYAKKAVKPATVKTSEDAGLETGTFVGIIREANDSLANGLPEFGQVTITSAAATSKKPAALTAKVQLAGKTYTFKSSDGWDSENEASAVKTMTLVQSVNKVAYTNTCTVGLRLGRTTGGDWANSDGEVELTMNVPDASGKSVQANKRYVGAVLRKNDKIKAYLDAVASFAGYYTFALGTRSTVATDRRAADKGTPEGYGYLTMTLSNKGVAKVAGLLPDGTKLSASSFAGLVRDEASPLGYSLSVPYYQSKSPFVFAGTITLRAVASDPAGHPDGRAYDIVSDTNDLLYWNNDSTSLTYDGRSGWRKVLEPVGGWYDTVFNLQKYYWDFALEVETTGEFPKEFLNSGYGYTLVANAKPDGTSVDLAANAFSLLKKAMVKSGKLYDLEASINPCDVQVKLARATGIVTGSFSVWSEATVGGGQKALTGFKHNGILLLQRGESETLAANVLTAGHVMRAVTLKKPNAAGKVVSRSWKWTAPFNLVNAGNLE